MIIVVLALTASVAGTYLYGRQSARTVAWHAAAGSKPAATQGPQSTIKDTSGNDLHGVIPDVLRAQGDALVKRNEAGWMAVVDPKATAVVARMRNLYTLFAAMRVTSWQAVLTNWEAYAPQFTPTAPDGTAIVLSASIGYCAQTATCPVYDPSAPNAQMENFLAAMTWTKSGSAWLMSTFTPAYQNLGARAQQPWLISSLKAVEGGKVTVLASPTMRVDLAHVLSLAQSAATNADKYAHWTKPSRYILYLADASQWRAWFGGESWANAIGYAFPTTFTSDVVVINYPEISAAYLPIVLRHEFGHVATLIGAAQATVGYLAEGMAEFVEEDGRPISQYLRLEDVRYFLNHHHWDGDLDKIDTYADDVDIANASYGMGYLTWRCIQKYYGDTKMWAFAGEVLRNFGDGPTSSPKTLGAPWSKVKSQCASFIRSVA